MRRFGSSAALLFAVLAGCRLFVDLDGITGTAPVDGGGGSEEAGGPNEAGVVLLPDGGTSIVDAGAPLLQDLVLLLHMEDPPSGTAGTFSDSSGKSPGRCSSGRTRSSGSTSARQPATSRSRPSR